MKKSVYFPLLGAAACSGLGGCNSKAEKQPQPPPNIVFILADDVGYGDLSCYGATEVQTPNVDRLAASGIRFLNAHAAAATSTPSRYALLTGQYPFRRNDTGIAAGNAPSIIKPEQKTVAAMLQTAGYTTGAVGKWHLGIGTDTNQPWNDYITPGPKELGFDYSYIMAATGDRVPCVYLENQRIVNLDPSDPVEVSYETPFPGEPLGRDHPELLFNLHPSHGHDMAIVNGISRIGYMKGGKQALWVDEYIADSITSKAVAFIENNRDKPFFLYFGTNDIHVPRWPHPQFVGKSGMGPRGDAILQFDWSVGQVLDALERNGLTENTLIILTSDNGPVIDDGYKDQAVELLGDHKPGGAFRGGKYSAFEAGTRVPFLVGWSRGGVEKGKESPALVSQVDFFATLAALAGQTLSDDAAPDSFDQLNVWLGKDGKGREYVMEQALSGTLSVVEGDWKYIEPSKQNNPILKNTATESGFITEPQLYNLKDDAGERNNIAAEHPDEVKKLAERVEKVKNTSKTRE
ncbi:MAG: arylsulfatase [Tannerella sp.]|nr:arylsulfatase [Tannerella sp.]